MVTSRGVGGGEGAGSHDPGFGVGSQMGLVVVPVFRPRLVHVAALGVDHRDHSVGGNPLCNLPGPVVLVFNVLAGDEGEQA